MAAYDFSSARLYLEAALAPGELVSLDRQQQNYLGNVLRLRDGEGLLVFNGRDGEFEARITGEGKRLNLTLGELRRPQPPRPRLHWLFAPLKHARLDYMVQKAVELGVGTIEPVMTRRTQVSRVNLERMRANVIEAAEQCGVLAVPEVREEQSLVKRLDGWDPAAPLVFCDEDSPVADPLTALRTLGGQPVGVLIGPEGGFDESERGALLRLPRVTRLWLGPRILRADTAAVAALALVQAVCGDWAGPADRAES
jgi:16S rRNA (uracil1498-N3)-methyltransferase